MLGIFLHLVEITVTRLGIFVGWPKLSHGSQCLVLLLDLPFLLERVLSHDGVEPHGC